MIFENKKNENVLNYSNENPLVASIFIEFDCTDAVDPNFTFELGRDSITLMHITNIAFNLIEWVKQKYRELKELNDDNENIFKKFYSISIFSTFLVNYLLSINWLS